MDKNILIIDDDIELCSLLKKCLEKDGMIPEVCYNGVDGLRKATDSAIDYHLIVLDVMLPGINGFEVLSELRKTSSVPVLMLTAKDSEIDKVSGLRLGADDYLTKPFSINEFTARAQSLIRRYTILNSSLKGKPEVLIFKGITINADERTVEVNNKAVDLTGREFELLYFLAINKGKVFTKKQIYNRVWKDEYEFDDSNIMSFISKLRKKLETSSDTPPYIDTVWGVGYRFSQEV